jgi:diketogulonate reductase-like aldo/keto reductase
MPDVSTLTLNNGVQLPALGLGVFQTPAEETRAAVDAAISAGYRHIDTAAAYGNERQVGDAVRSSGLDRSEVFLETKIWISDYGYDKTLHGFEKSARKLGVDQIDLLILHQALPSEFDATLDAYRALETLLGDGKVRAIGVSNFMVDHLSTLLDRATVVPAVNQIEVHPYFQQRDVQVLGAEHNIVTQAWSPIGGITFYRDSQHTSTLDDPVISPEVDQAGSDRGEHRRLRLRPQRRRACRDRRSRHRQTRRPRARSHHLGELRTTHPRGLNQTTGPVWLSTDRPSATSRTVLPHQPITRGRNDHPNPRR